MSSDTPEIAPLCRYIDAVQLNEDIAVDLTNITDGLSKQTSLFVHYASLAVKAKRQYERWKVALEVTEAQLESHYRSTLKEINPKTTEPQIRAAVVQDAKFKAVSTRVIDAQEIFRLCDVAERSFDHRRDMLLQIARDAAREGAGSLRVVANQTNRDRILDAMNSGKGASSAITG